MHGLKQYMKARVSADKPSKEMHRKVQRCPVDMINSVPAENPVKISVSHLGNTSRYLRKLFQFPPNYAIFCYCIKNKLYF